MKSKIVIVTLIAVLAFAASTSSAFARRPFGFVDVQKIAKDVSNHPFESPEDKLPEILKNMGYDQWRDIRFKESKTLWGQDKEPFKVRFFHPGFIYKQPVIVHFIDEKGVHNFGFSPVLFDYGKTNLGKDIPVQSGFAGFRIHYPLNSAEYADELVAFLGASYFRALPQGLAYGMSARGLAVNTAVDGGEEFPLFREFWIIKPKLKDKKITVYALLDSPSVAGAYQYVIEPGDQTIMNVKSTLYIRRHIEKLGIAPLTSMYFYGENTKAAGINDYRPEVHDSDGLMIHAKSGEWIWRPFDNPARLAINSFFIDTPKGFGMEQRDTNFDHYQDLEARYELRPSVWVELKDDWGRGHVELIQIPTHNEYNDNMNVFWVPEHKPEEGDVLNYSYQLQWHAANRKHFPLAYVTSTHVMREDNGIRFLLDFKGETIENLEEDEVLKADISVSRGYHIAHSQVIKNKAAGGWRLVFLLQENKEGALQDLIPSPKPAAELRAALKTQSDDKAATETWTYTWMP